MNIIRNQKIKYTVAVNASRSDDTKHACTGYARLVRFVTDNPVPQQTSFTGKINLQ